METRDGVGTGAGRAYIGVAETPAEYVVFRPKLYVDTSVPSYIAARPSRDPQKAHWQRVTQEWWELYRWQFDVYYSGYVEEEANKGDPLAANERLRKLTPFKKLPKSKAVEDFAARILNAAHLPEKAMTDAKHVAVAAMHTVKYLLSLNCKHLANQQIQTRIMYICHKEGYTAPLILTPDEAIRLRAHEISNR